MTIVYELISYAVLNVMCEWIFVCTDKSFVQLRKKQV